jgi:endonuclease G, mitochondrial
MRKAAAKSKSIQLSPYLKKAAFGASAFAAGAASSAGIITSLPNAEKPLSKKTTVMTASLPATSYVIERAGYSLSYDPRTRNPIYVYEKLSANSLAGRVSRENFQFKEDPRIPKIFRSTLIDYQGSGYDRGHLAPAADHKCSSESMSDTFYLSNMCPQVPQFNRGYWSQLEKHVRELTKDYKTVEVFSGPLYLPNDDKRGNRIVSYSVIGENDVAVPTHFFKVLFLEEGKGDLKMQAYILPNAEIASDTPLDKFIVPIEKVQKAAGILFKSNLHS